MTKTNLISGDECMYLEGVEETIMHINELSNELMGEIVYYFNNEGN